MKGLGKAVIVAVDLGADRRDDVVCGESPWQARAIEGRGRPLLARFATA